MFLWNFLCIALQKEAALQRVRLNYEEVDLPFDALQTWEMLLSRPHARIDSSITCAGIKQGMNLKMSLLFLSIATIFLLIIYFSRWSIVDFCYQILLETHKLECIEVYTGCKIVWMTKGWDNLNFSIDLNYGIAAINLDFLIKDVAKWIN